MAAYGYIHLLTHLYVWYVIVVKGNVLWSLIIVILSHILVNVAK